MSNLTIDLPYTNGLTVDEKLRYVQSKLREVETIEYRNLYSKEKVLDDRQYFTLIFKKLILLKSEEKKPVHDYKMNELYS